MLNILTLLNYSTKDHFHRYTQGSEGRKGSKRAWHTIPAQRRIFINVLKYAITQNSEILSKKHKPLPPLNDFDKNLSYPLDLQLSLRRKSHEVNNIDF